MTDAWCHDVMMSWHLMSQCAVLMSGHRPGGVQALCCILLIFVTRRGWLEPERGAGRGNPGFDSPGERDWRQGPSHANHPVFINYLSFYFDWTIFQNNFSIGDRLCPVTIIRRSQPPVPSHVWSSELGVTTEFPSSCNNFTQPADTDRQLGSSQSLHITGQHENCETTHHHTIFPLQSKVQTGGFVRRGRGRG